MFENIQNQLCLENETQMPNRTSICWLPTNTTKKINIFMKQLKIFTTPPIKKTKPIAPRVPKRSPHRTTDIYLMIPQKNGTKPEGQRLTTESRKVFMLSGRVSLCVVVRAIWIFYTEKIQRPDELAAIPPPILGPARGFAIISEPWWAAGSGIDEN